MKIYLFLILNLILRVRLDNLIESNLKKSLIGSSYDKSTRPSWTVFVWLDLFYKQIVTIDEKNQVVSSSFYLVASWIDERLQWSYDNYSIKYMTVKANQLWLPDLYVINTADPNGFLPVNDAALATVDLNGKVTVNYGVNGLKTRCSINVFKFPYDKQTCSLIIGSWFQSNQEVRLLIDLNKLKDTSEITKNPIWDFVSVNFEIKNSSRLAENYRTDDVYFNATVKRGALYYMINNVYPCLILNIVTLLTFFLPFALQASLTLTIFLNMAIISVRVSGDIPVQSEYLPLISLYFLLSLFYTFISLNWFVVVNYFRTKNQLPKCLESLAIYVRLICTLSTTRIKINNKIDDIVQSSRNNDDNNIKQIEDLVSKINLLAFFVLVISMFTSYLAIWLIITN